jgi:SAM-dependent methyltransferase
MKISIFTPSHSPSFLETAYASIKDQDFHEWVVLLNGAAEYENPDPRVKIFRDETGVDFVGYLKWQCCKHATGDILLELDHDDLLTPDCIAEVKKAFDDPEIGFVYSNTISAHMDWKPTQRFNEGNGWEYRSVTFQGHLLDEYIAFAPTPGSVSQIWYAPNHVRAFRKDVYEKAGGYNRQMRVLDDLDLMCRMYLETRFQHIDKPLYLYRVHGQNAWLVHNSEIQNNVYRIHDQYIERMAMKWSDLNGLRKIELGGRMNAAAGFETVDLKDADIICDLNERWPFEDNSVGVVRAYDVFEHLLDSVHTMKELFRVLAPGGYAIIQVPSTDGRGAFQDPTHRTAWNENSFLYYTDARWAKYIDTPVYFQAVRCYTTEHDANQVCWVKAHLMKLIDGQRVPGKVFI